MYQKKKPFKPLYIHPWTLASFLINTQAKMVNQTLYSLFIFSLSMHCFIACLASEVGNHQLANQTFRSEELHKLKKMITSRLKQINKPAVKTIQVC